MEKRDKVRADLALIWLGSAAYKFFQCPARSPLHLRRSPYLFLTATDLPVDLCAVGELLDPAGLGVDAHPRHVAVQGQVRPARQHRRRPGRHRHVGRRSLDRLLPADKQRQE